MGNSSSARRRTQSGAIASPASRTAVVPIAKPEKFRSVEFLIPYLSIAPILKFPFPDN
jgi:hypothetical protein